MKSLLIAAALSTFVPSISAAQEPREIFDGRSLAGWEGLGEYWRVEDGAIVGRSDAEHPLERSTWLIWRGGAVGDFRLEFEYRLIGGNSGVQFRSRDLGEFQVAGYQADLEDGPDWSGCLYEQEGRGVSARRGQSVRFDADGTRSTLDVADGAALMTHVRAREWNRATIVARGPSIAIAINGAIMTTVTDLDATRAASRGVLALQLHQGPPMEVRFRNLRLTDYGSSPEAARPSSASAATPQWIWSQSTPAANERALFVRRFELSAPPRRARFTGGADNHFEVLVNGHTRIDHDDWAKPVWLDIAPWLVAGENHIEVRAQNDGGPAAWQGLLEIEAADGARTTIATDARWSVIDEDGTERPATVLGPLGREPWGQLAPAVPYAPQAALAAEELQLPEGFRAELLFSVPRRAMGSWVSMCFDDEGRILASDQYGPIHRVTLTDGRVSKVEALDLPLGSAQGLCFAFGALYAVVAESGDGYSPGLWRVKHSKSDDRFAAPELLRAFEGDGEHGPHAVLPSPDGRGLFVVGGNHTKVPDPLAISWVPQRWGEDQLLPQHADPNGHAVGITAPGGWICRTDPNGATWELFAAGFRNAYDMAFDARGEAFTFDSDMEWDIGLPWYRPTMVQHVVAGGDYGWRTGSWRWPEHYVDSLPGAVDVGASSPTGMCFVPPDAKFRLPGDATLLIGDWAYGRILSVALEPEGASFRGRVSPFLSGKPLPVTDMAFGPDGALYFLVGGRRTQSALYRVRAVLDDRIAPAAPPTELARARAALAARLNERSNLAVQAALDALDSGDRFVRFTARALLEQQDPSLWLDRALAEQRPWASIEALIAVARCADSSQRDRALERFAALPVETLDLERRLASLRALELVLVRLGRPTGARAQALSRRLDAMYPTASVRVDRELCQLLVAMEEPRVISKTLTLIDSTLVAEDQIALAWSLRSMRKGWTVGERVRYFRWIHQTAGPWSGGLSFSKYLDRLRDDALATIDPAERQQLGSALDKPQRASGAAEVSSVQRALVRRWTIEDLQVSAAASGGGHDFARGQRLYKEARCFDCHRIAGEGGGSGPDLTGAGARFGVRDLLEALIEPSRTVSDQYQDTQVWTTDDEMFVGRIERAANGDLRVWPADATEAHEIEAARVAEVRPYKLSRMPAGLLDTFHEDEIADLIAYLRSGANPKDPAFADGR